jgi:hypothetical protein
MDAALCRRSTELNSAVILQCYLGIFRRMTRNYNEPNATDNIQHPIHYVIYLALVTSAALNGTVLVNNMHTFSDRQIEEDFMQVEQRRIELKNKNSNSNCIQRNLVN